MNIPKEAIEKAIEGGWKERFRDSHWSTNNNQVKIYHWEAIALDPTFWQALGKALGWKEAHDPTRFDYTWEGHAHRFYDLILQGQSTEAFWKELLV